MPVRVATRVGRRKNLKTLSVARKVDGGANYIWLTLCSAPKFYSLLIYYDFLDFWRCLGEVPPVA
jgi:hypothetical protein